MERILIVSLFVGAIVQCKDYTFKGIDFTADVGERPRVDPDEWWGPEELKGKEDQSVRPFRVEFTDEMIADLRYRLQNRRPFTAPLQDVGFNYGFNRIEMERWLKFRAEEYPFKEREEYINQFPMYKTNIQGLDIQFVHVKPEVPAGVEIVPLILLHGWPGTFLEFYKTIPLITAYDEGRDFAVEIIVPSIPGFAYSDGAVRAGLGYAQIASIFRNLMQRLGHAQFYVQAGDVGRTIGRAMATLYPEQVLGFHFNFPLILNPKALLLQVVGSVEPSLVVQPAVESRMYPLINGLRTWRTEFGYMYKQGTKPDTVGMGLSDSPAALLAWLLEPSSAVANIDYKNRTDGGLEEFNKAEWIDFLMMHWVPNAATTAMRYYSEAFNKDNVFSGIDQYPSPVPAWTIQAKHEILYQSAAIIQVKFPNLLKDDPIETGGHFLAHELPDVFAASVLEAVQAFREWRKTHPEPSLNDESVKQTYQNLTDISRKLAEIAKQKSGSYPAIFWTLQCLLLEDCD